MDRRTWLRGAGGAVVLSAAYAVPGIAATASRAVLLVPTGGDHAGLGTSMRRAAMLAQSDAKALRVAGDAAGAAREVRRGAAMVLGPLFSADVRRVLAAVGGRVPVITFSNDEGLRDSGAFLLGVTATQLATAILRYARGRGVRRVAVPADASAWNAQARQAAGRVAAELGLTVATDGAADAVLLTDPAGPAAATARATGAQLLLCTPEVDARPETLAALSGAWMAAPDPAGFAAFADRYRTVNGGDPGLLAALAHDAVGIAMKVGAGGRAAVLDTGGFPGAAGTVRFRTDGTAERTLAILAVAPGGHQVIGQGTGG